MGYQNLSFSVGKTPEEVLGPKFFFGSGQEAVDVRPVENLSASKSRFFNFQLDFPPKISTLTKNDHDLIEYFRSIIRERDAMVSLTALAQSPGLVPM